MILPRWPSSTTSPHVPGHVIPHVALPLMGFPISRLPLQSARVHFARPSRPRPASIICACPHMPASLAPHLTSPPPARAAGHRTAPRALPRSPLRFAPATASRTAENSFAVTVTGITWGLRVRHLRATPTPTAEGAGKARLRTLTRTAPRHLLTPTPLSSLRTTIMSRSMPSPTLRSYPLRPPPPQTNNSRTAATPTTPTTPTTPMYSTMHKLKRFLLVFALIWARSHGVRLHN